MTLLVLVLETLLAPFAALGVVLSFAFSRRRGLLSALAAELPERLGALGDAGRARLLGRRVWWLHAASAGEVAGLSPLIDALDAAPGGPAVLVTTTTAAGRDAARRNPKVAWAQLAPLDAWPCVARFLRETKPERMIISETELWPSTILLAARAGLKPALINARMTERSLPRYRAAAFLLRPALGALSLVLAQSDLDADSFRAIGVGAGKLAVAGNTKYDRLAARPDGTAAAGALEILGWDRAPLFVAGSTHPVEEAMILEAFALAAAAVPRLRLVLAPRHVERVAELLDALTARGVAFARLSSVHDAESGVPVLVLDAMGALPSFWPRAAAAFVGGTLVPVGGHNLLEPAAAGAPVLFGPYTRHVDYPAVLLESGGGGFRVADGAALGRKLVSLLQDPGRSRAAGDRARDVADGLRGATGRTLTALGRV
ncbi:MAG TPA: glycosyltransferase N-terminal domain-containing protein [Elusimicrobiota bacterium]|jgi:3-deoxy-D-manno-octulosonic-acid transferase|nr:glycosyltransferase N-terminal domain-containing protein [Elusimicrobiota bacterium]